MKKINKLSKKILVITLSLSLLLTQLTVDFERSNIPLNTDELSLVNGKTEILNEVSILNRSLGIVTINSFYEYISTNSINETKTTGNTIKDSVYSLKETVTYIYGNGLISEYKNNVVLYHHYNNLGSTTALTDAGGNIIATYTYGAYGELLSGDNVITKYLYNGRAGVSTEDNGLYYMRQRYYNPEIKRFINRDVVTGTLGNSQSINRYSYVQGNPISLTDPFGLSPINGLFSGGSFNLGGLLLAGIHTALDVAGSGVGIISTVANAVNAVLYAAVDKDYAMAALSAVSAISLGAGNIAKLVGKGSFGAATIRVTGNIISGMTNFGVNASMAVDIADQMLDKYVWGDQEFGEEGKAEVLFLALSIYGGLNSVAVAMHNAKQLGNMMKCVDEQSKELEYLIKQLSNSQVKASESGSGTKYYNQDGSPIWPENRGFDGKPSATILQPGTKVDRFGYDSGTFVSPVGTPYTNRSLPIGTDKKPYTVFEILKPVEVQAGKIAPWFGEKGGGIQYEFSSPISELIDLEILRKVGN